MSGFRCTWLLLAGCCIARGTADTNAPILTLQQAREIALASHPRVIAAEFRKLAATEVVKQARAPFFPNIVANATAVGTADDNTRIAAGSLSNPAIFERNAEGILVTQLLTDFGRTANLTSSALFRARAEQENELATRAQLIMLVDTAYFSALESQSVLEVAQQTVNTRQTLLNQVSALASNKLRSDLDVDFARVTLEEGKLLLLRSENDLQAARARLATLLSEPQTNDFRLGEEPLSSNAFTNLNDLITEALQNRPDLVQRRLEHEAALRFAKAERGLRYPAINAFGSAGLIPVRDEHFDDHYAAAGINLSIPIFAGGSLVARQHEAEYRARIAEEARRDEENNTVRDVRIAWLSLNTAAERLNVT